MARDEGRRGGIGLGGKVGGLEVGMVWDVILVGADEVPVDQDGEEAEKMLNGVHHDHDGKQTKIGGKVDFFGWETWEEKLAKWLFSGDDRNIRAVWVGGELVCRK
ncbi:hypothetical protein B9Z19DRAFT_1173802 [Tuber borchii]|uniref:Amidohydrolase-related domain-containing protein n=1 Tax=Tuber borchii TaxID=42251 RepID=A0A2T6Z9L9_TUBBO|nr:hypothetical protein B9Z19DRAFT_1173802 [Tuber borchii]